MTTLLKPDGRVFLGEGEDGLCMETQVGEGAAAKRITVTQLEMGNAAIEYMKMQMERPMSIHLAPPEIWAYRNFVFVIKDAVKAAYSQDQILLMIRHSALKEERKWRRMESLVSATEKSSSNPPREHIPDAVKQYVWRRDQGRCVKCGSNENLEYDHIIPVALGGSSTDRNLQLLCEPCNRSKSASI